VPLLRIKHSSTATVELEVVRGKYGDPYIAILHVWTGGLGNPRANALPQCQLQAIAETGIQVRKLFEGTRDPSFPNLFRQIHRAMRLSDVDLFWVDTLCIPVRQNRNGDETDESKNVRAAAIYRMTQIYAGAHSVVIMDPELRSLPDDIPTHNSEEFFGRLLRSDWMRRYWAYQEGAMGGRLITLLQTGLVYVTREHYKIRNENSSSQLLTDLTQWLRRIPAPRRSREYHASPYITGTEHETFLEVWNNLLNRSTTRPADRLLIFALMVKLVPGRLCSQNSWGWDIKKKLRIISGSLTALPMYFLFGERTGDYWLPESINQRVVFTGGLLSRKNLSTIFSLSTPRRQMLVKTILLCTPYLQVPFSLVILPLSKLGSAIKFSCISH
jgi:hypothetical protein